MTDDFAIYRMRHDLSTDIKIYIYIGIYTFLHIHMHHNSGPQSSVRQVRAFMSRMNESEPTREWGMSISHMWMSHFSHVNESCRTYEWTMSHVLHMNDSSRACEWVMSHTWMSHVARTNESRVTRQVWMRHIAHVNESCLTFEWVMSHVRMIYVSRMDAWHRTYEWVMRLDKFVLRCHIWMSRIAHMNESWATCKWVMTHM